MSATKLYMARGTCARVTAIALEEIGEPFETVLTRFVKGEHKSPDYLRAWRPFSPVKNVRDGSGERPVLQCRKTLP